MTVETAEKEYWFALQGSDLSFYRFESRQDRDSFVNYAVTRSAYSMFIDDFPEGYHDIEWRKGKDQTSLVEYEYCDASISVFSAPGVK